MVLRACSCKCDYHERQKLYGRQRRILILGRHYIEEVKGVQQVLDQEEEIAIQEFAKFEEKLRQQKGEAAVASTGGKGTLDASP